MAKKNKTHILIVDDEADFLTVIEAWMVSRGFKVTTAENGKICLGKFNANRPDIIFMDIMMPEMDGIETLKEIRKLDDKVPVVLMTAYGLSKKIEEAEDYGVFGFFRKSEDFKQAAEIISKAIEAIDK